MSHWPTFQRRGNAAHLIEARIPLTADDLQEEEGAKLGLKVPLVAGREACGALQGRRKGTLLFSPRGRETSHFTRSMRSKLDANV